MIWDGRERRMESSDGREGRRQADWHCGEHHEIQLNTRDHRAIVCGKITEIKVSHEADLNELKSDRKSDMKELKLMLDNKANNSDLKGIMRLIGLLISILIVVVGGAVAWLKTDMGVMVSSVQRLNVRVTESMNDRIATDIEQTKSLETITGQLNVINWRLTEIEASHKLPSGSVNRP